MLSREELLDGLDPTASDICDRLIRGRLLSIRRLDRVGERGGQIELPHESLIFTWSRLARWLDEAHDSIVQLDDLSSAAEIWDKQRRPASGVWDGVSLLTAERVLHTLQNRVPTLVREFVAAGVAKRERLRRRRRLVLACVLLAALLGVLVSLAVVLKISKSEEQARSERDRAEAGMYSIA